MKFLIGNENSRKHGIYKITNVNTGKVYIGQTQETFQRRYWLHRWKLKQNSHDNKYLQHSWNKHGEESFIFELVEILEGYDKALIDSKETLWISEYSKTTGVYNIQSGGQPERLIDYVSPEGRKRVGEMNRRRMIGLKLSEETKHKMSLQKLGKRIYKANDTLNDDQIIEIKKMYMNGYSSRDIMDKLNVSYKSLNNIISNNAYKTVHVEGWDDFYKKHKQEALERKQKSQQLHSKIVEMFNYGYTRREIEQECNVNRNTVKYHLKKEHLL